MKFEEIFLSLLAEQQDDDDNLDFLDLPDDQEPNEPVDPADDEEPEEPKVQPQTQQPKDPNRPEPPKKLTRTQMVKVKWKEEEPGATEQQMNDAIMFFNERRERIKPYKPYGATDDAGRHYVNTPEITSMAQRFPNMIPILSDLTKLKDLMNYSWEQITFYQNRVIQQAMQFDDETWVKGDYTEDDRIQMALERWKSSFNRIYTDGTLTVYKIESQSEAVALGAIEHALWRKYNIEILGRDKRAALTYERDGVVYDGGIHPDILRQINSGPRSYEFAFGPWCIARPKDGNYGPNLWTNYRPEYGLYFVLDNSKPEWDEWHINTILIDEYGNYQQSGLPNDQKRTTWNDIVREYPALQDKRELFKYFGTTPRERKELTLDSISMRKTDRNYFGNYPPTVHATYINNNRHITSKDAFLTLDFVNRKLYVDKARNDANQDYKRRFICTDPSDEPMAILDILKNEKVNIPGHGPGTGDTNLYKYLDGFILKTREHVEKGILSIRLDLLNQKWKRSFTDEEKSYALCTSRDTLTRYNRLQKFGVIDLNTLDSIREPGTYIPTVSRSYIFLEEDENGIKRWGQPHTLQRYTKVAISDQRVTNENDYFYFWFITSAVKPSSPDFNKGKYYDERGGSEFIEQIQSRIQEGTAKRI